jgi:alkanesulfonate monooxygenase SsuD/methylene tetrahydromethanopterin reductase-like flavin-dependent oxidoreductase (luciferase family)
MQFAAFALAGSSAREDPEVIFKRVVEYAIEAEELGYDAVWFAEHHFSNYGYIPNPLLMATKIAAETSKIRVGTAVLVLPFWDPLRVAEDIALTDQLTGGRLEVGVARGYQPFEFRRFGLTMEEARDHTEESLAIITRALTGETFEYEGKFHQIPETTLYPKPLQQPSPPLWLAATTQESFDIGRQYGLRSLTSQSGRPVSVLEQAWSNFQNSRQKYPDATADFGVQGQVVVTPTEDESREQMEHFLYQSRQATNLRHGREHVVSGVSEPLPFEGEPDLDEMFENRTLSGTPPSVIRKLKRYTDIADINMLSCVMHGGGMTHDTVMQSLRLFAKEVIPAFRD